MDEVQRAALEEILGHLRAEEGEQEAERGFASTHVARAAAQLSQLLEAAS